MAGVVSLLLVGYLRFRRKTKPLKISGPVIPFGLIHVPGYSNDNINDAISNDIIDDPNVTNTSHPHYLNIFAEIFPATNDDRNENINNDNTTTDDTNHSASNDISNDVFCANDSSVATRSKSDTNNDCYNNNSNANENDNPPPNYQDVMAETYVPRTLGVPVKDRNKKGANDCENDPTQSDENIYAEIYDVPRIPSIPVRCAEQMSNNDM